MIFEDITDTDHKLRRTKRNTTQLISKYVELKKFETIYQASSSLRKRKLRHPEVKRYVLRLIHNEVHRRMKPEETFEVWHRSITEKEEDKSKQKGKRKKTKLGSHDQQFGNDQLIEEIYEFLDTSVPDDLNEDSSDLDLQVDDLDDDEEYDEYDIVSSVMLDQLSKEFDTRNSLTKTRFFIESSGLEIMPESNVTSTHAVLNQHINNINTLLHINILRRNWNVSYKLFCIMMRFPMVDIRQVWPLGIEILTQLGTMKTSLPATMNITKFFNYLNSFFTIGYRNTISIERSDRSSIAPAWRSGTRSLTPLYLITSLWHLFVQQEYEQILNKILELILEPPYHREGVLYFMVALCHLCQCCTAVNHFALQHDLDKFNDTGATYRSMKECLNLLNLNWSKIEANVKKCKEFGFELPALELKSQWEMIVDKLHEADSSIERGKLATNETTVVDTIPDIMERDDWNEIESDQDDMSPPLDTSTQNKRDYHSETVFDHENDYNADDDWSQIHSDSEGEEHSEKRPDKAVEEETDTLVDDNNEWGEISSDSEQEQEMGEELNDTQKIIQTEIPTQQDLSDELVDTQKIDTKSLRNETPTQHDNVIFNGDRTMPIQQDNDDVAELDQDMDFDMDFDMDDDWGQIDSDPEDDEATDQKGSISYSSFGEGLNGWSSPRGDEHNRVNVSESVKQVDDSVLSSQGEENKPDYELKWSQTDGSEVETGSFGGNQNEKLVDRTFDEDGTLDKHSSVKLANKTELQDNGFGLEWSQIGDEDISVNSSPMHMRSQEPSLSKEPNNGLSAVSDEESRMTNDDWDLEWSQIDDDELPSDNDQETFTSHIGDEEKARRLESSGTDYAPSLGSLSTSNSNHASNTGNSSNLLTPSASADDSIEDSLVSSFDHRRNSIELHQRRLKSDEKWKSKNKHKRKRDRQLKKDLKVRKQLHRKERKQKYNRKQNKAKGKRGLIK
ncbi:RRN11 [Candida metapsilosis]|uniref:RRN11 n=1 Tax=Candida metapsilosis TaxID=273372 RepID=A0A8H8DCB6_9ASCO|nr:RRN11 [Candida metapsilosis]